MILFVDKDTTLFRSSSIRYRGWLYSGDVYVFFSKDRRTMKALKWDGDGFLMYTKRLSQGRFREVLKKGDDGVRRLQWDDFYMLMRGLTPVKVTVENRFRMAAK